METSKLKETISRLQTLWKNNLYITSYFSIEFSIMIIYGVFIHTYAGGLNSHGYNLTNFSYLDFNRRLITKDKT